MEAGRGRVKSGRMKGKIKTEHPITTITTHYFNKKGAEKKGGRVSECEARRN